METRIMFDENLYVFSCVCIFFCWTPSLWVFILQLGCRVLSSNVHQLAFWYRYVIWLIVINGVPLSTHVEQPLKMPLSWRLVLRRVSMSKSQKASIVQSGWCYTMFGPLAHYNKYKPNDYRYAMIKINGKKKPKTQRNNKRQCFKKWQTQQSFDFFENQIVNSLFIFNMHHIKSNRLLMHCDFCDMINLFTLRLWHFHSNLNSQYSSHTSFSIAALHFHLMLFFGVKIHWTLWLIEHRPNRSEIILKWNQDDEEKIV